MSKQLELMVQDFRSRPFKEPVVVRHAIVDAVVSLALASGIVVFLARDVLVAVFNGF